MWVMWMQVSFSILLYVCATCTQRKTVGLHGSELDFNMTYAMCYYLAGLDVAWWMLDKNELGVSHQGYSAILELCKPQTRASIMLRATHLKHLPSAWVSNWQIQRSSSVSRTRYRKNIGANLIDVCKPPVVQQLFVLFFQNFVAQT